MLDFVGRCCRKVQWQDTNNSLSTALYGITFTICVATHISQGTFVKPRVSHVPSFRRLFREPCQGRRPRHMTEDARIGHICRTAILRFTFVIGAVWFFARVHLQVRGRLVLLCGLCCKDDSDVESIPQHADSRDRCNFKQ